MTRRGRIRRRFRALVRDDGVMSVALGAALALSAVALAAGAAELVVGPFRDWTLVAVPGLELLLVLTLVAVARLRLRPRARGSPDGAI